jgi:signal transduction histidine kinase
MNATTERTQKQLETLAEYLAQSRESILNTWCQRVDGDPTLTTCSRLTQAPFIDHLPLVIDTLCAKLRSLPDDDRTAPQQLERKAAESHSLTRWQQGYDMRTIVREWGHLNTCLVQEIDSYAIRQSNMEAVVLLEAHSTLAEFVNDGITLSVAEYYRLLQAEAAARTRDLEVGLEQLHEMEQARGLLMRTSAHDLKGSLTVVMCSASMMDDESLSVQERVEMLHRLQRGVSTLEHMLVDLMDVTRLDAGQEQRKIEVVDVGQVFSHLCATSLSLADARGLYIKAHGPESLQVEGDLEKVGRIAQNLLLNALKYTREGGVSMTWQEHEDDQWILCVQDTGPGLESSTAAPLARKLEEATEVAYELEGNSNEIANLPLERELETTVVPPPLAELCAHGEGIGLSIVKRLCELLEATLELDSKAGVGTTFRVIFPRHYGPESSDL